MRKIAWILALWMIVFASVASASSLGGPELLDGDRLQFEAILNPNLPEMVITIEKTGVETQDNIEIKQYQVKVAMKDNPESPVQTFEARSEQALDPTFFVTLVDINFDGYLDLDMLYAVYASNVAHSFFVWNPENGEFVALNDDHRISSYTLFPDQKLLYNYIHDSALTGTSEIYRFEGGVFTLQRKLETTMVSDSECSLIVTDGPGAVSRDEKVASAKLEEMVKSGELDQILWEGIDRGEPQAEG